MRRTLPPKVAALAVLLGLAFGVGMMPPCVTEDSTGCYWNAQTMGNGEGRSFVALGELVIYLP